MISLTQLLCNSPTIIATFFFDYFIFTELTGFFAIYVDFWRIFVIRNIDILGQTVTISLNY